MAISMLNSKVVLCYAIRIIRVKDNILNRQKMLLREVLLRNLYVFSPRETINAAIAIEFAWDWLQEEGEARSSSFLFLSTSSSPFLFLFSSFLYIHRPDNQPLIIERLGIDVVHAYVTDGRPPSNFFRGTLIRYLTTITA